MARAACAERRTRISLSLLLASSCWPIIAAVGGVISAAAGEIALPANVSDVLGVYADGRPLLSAGTVCPPGRIPTCRRSRVLDTHAMPVLTSILPWVKIDDLGVEGTTTSS